MIRIDGVCTNLSVWHYVSYFIKKKIKLFVHFVIPIQYLFFFPTNKPLFIVFQSSITIQLTIINKGVFSK